MHRDDEKRSFPPDVKCITGFDAKRGGKGTAHLVHYSTKCMRINENQGIGSGFACKSMLRRQRSCHESAICANIGVLRTVTHNILWYDKKEAYFSDFLSGKIVVRTEVLCYNDFN